MDVAEKFLLKSGVQCKWDQFDPTYVDSLSENSESSKSRSCYPLGGPAHDDTLSIMSQSSTEQPPSTSDEFKRYLNNKNISKPVKQRDVATNASGSVRFQAVLKNSVFHLFLCHVLSIEFMCHYLHVAYSVNSVFNQLSQPSNFFAPRSGNFFGYDQKGVRGSN